jgi:hypothetical protein
MTKPRRRRRFGRATSPRRGGIEWTIKDGIPYHAPTLMSQTRDMVAQARAEQAWKGK